MQISRNLGTKSHLIDNIYSCKLWDSNTYNSEPIEEVLNENATVSKKSLNQNNRSILIILIAKDKSG